jgi:hypothetical protein
VAAERDETRHVKSSQPADPAQPSNCFPSDSRVSGVRLREQQPELALPSATCATSINSSHRHPRHMHRRPRLVALPPSASCMATFDSRDRGPPLPARPHSNVCITISHLSAWRVSAPRASGDLIAHLVSSGRICATRRTQSPLSAKGISANKKGVLRAG